MRIETEIQVACSEKLADERKSLTGKALDELWKQSWIRENIGPADERLEALRKELQTFQNKCDLIVVVAQGAMKDVLRGMLLAFQDKVETDEAISEDAKPKGKAHRLLVMDGGLSATAYRNLFQEMDQHSCGLLAIGYTDVELADRTAFAAIRRRLEDRYGAGEAATRIVVVAGQKADYLLEEARQGGYAVFGLADDVTPPWAAGTAAAGIPLLLMGLDAAGFLAGFRRMISETGWDLNLDRFALVLSGVKKEKVVYWQQELRGTAEWLTAIHRDLGIDAEAMFLPEGKRPKRTGGESEPEVMSEAGGNEGQEDTLYTHLFAEREAVDIMLPQVPGGDEWGSLNAMTRAGARNFFEEHGGVWIALESVDEENYGELMAYLQISYGITKFILLNYALL